MSFQEQVKDHLGDYKKKVLEIKKDGVYNYKGREIEYGHILPRKPEDFSNLNIIRNYRKQFYDSKYSKIDYHRFFHHLNSSQALCINFFYPFICEGNFKPIQDLLNLPIEKCLKYEFEFVSDIEKSGSKKTNFDFFFETEGSDRIYVEAKYTEQEFGKTKSDPSHKKKYAQTYLPLLEKNTFIKEECKTEDFFLKNYQIMRNLIHIDNKSRVIFFYPKANKKIDNQAVFASEEILNEWGRKRYMILYLEDAIQNILDTVANKKIQAHFKEFESKYLKYTSNLFKH